MQIVLLAAVAENGVIGRDGAMPWRIKSDMQHFRKLTMGKPVVMGRKTYLSLSLKPLPGRTNIVVSRDATFTAPGVLVAPSLDAALAAARGDAMRRGADIMVIGGAAIYAQAMPLADRLEITVVRAAPEGDSYFPSIDPAIWRKTAREAHPAGEGDDADLVFMTFQRGSEPEPIDLQPLRDTLPRVANVGGGNMTHQGTEAAQDVGQAGERSAEQTERESEYRKKIGVIFVHGIGEQRRFTHLDGEVRPLLEALKRRGAEVTTEISAGTAATLRAEQDTWSTQDGAPVRAFIKDPKYGKYRLDFHEVWWADVNEEYTFKKQVLFWLWGLGMWWMPFQPTGRETGVTRLPDFPHPTTHSGSKKISRERKGDPLSVRIQLYLVSNLFLMGAFSIGLVAYVVKRVFGYEPPDFVRVLVNYLSAVRLYSQAERAGGGFLDAYKEPPRVSVRRRMIRTIVDVAALEYDRWYIFGHSLGSVVAYNGVMENNLALPNYLDEQRWKKLLKKKWAGTGKNGEKVSRPMLPARPLWLGETDVVYRDKLFHRFAGLLTYGSPLDKFAMLWKGQVPINCGEPIKYIPPDASKPPQEPEWINVYDQTDPVGASLQAFNPKNDKSGQESLLPPKNFGYCAGPVWLVSHLEYLKIHPGRTGELSDALMKWVLSGEAFQQEQSDSWYEPEGDVHWARRRSRQFQQWGGYFILLALAAITLPSLLKGIGQLAGKVFELSPTFPQVIAEPVTFVFDKIKMGVVWCADWFVWVGALVSGIFKTYLWEWVADILSSGFVGYLVLVAFAVALVTGLAGLIGHAGGFDDPDKNTKTAG